jgi:hypothetical protein
MHATDDSSALKAVHTLLSSTLGFSINEMKLLAIGPQATLQTERPPLVGEF